MMVVDRRERDRLSWFVVGMPKWLRVHPES